MNILYCGDSNIAKGVFMSAMSMADHAVEGLDIYIVTAGFKYGDREYKPLGEKFAYMLDMYLKKVNSSHQVHLYDESQVFIKELPQANIDTRFTPFCMLRLIADKLNYLPDKILYVDNDVICMGDFSGFYNTDISTYELAGVLDHYGKWFFKKKIFKFDYINSGVLLLNLENIRKTGLFEKCRIRCRNKKMLMPDQSAINKLSSRKMIVNGIYNEQRYDTEESIFRHFSTTFRFFPYFHTVTVKPWETDKVRTILNTQKYDELFNRYEAVLSKIPSEYWE